MTRFHLHADHPGRASVLANALTFLSRLPSSQSWEIVIRPLVKARTEPQNAALFGCAYKALMEFCGYQGEQDRQEMHRNFCGEFFGWVDLPTGGQRPRRTTTTDEQGRRDVLPWDTFSEFYAMVQRQGQQLGCYVPDPDPLYKEPKAQRPARRAENDHA